jgi:hypothetical protein
VRHRRNIFLHSSKQQSTAIVKIDVTNNDARCGMHDGHNLAHTTSTLIQTVLVHLPPRLESISDTPFPQTVWRSSQLEL